MKVLKYAVFIVSIMVIFIFSISVALAQNIGTVKIHDGSSDTEPVIRNEPHVCTFHLHFFFGEMTQNFTWEIREWAPNDKGLLVLSGSGSTDSSGEARQPLSGDYSLPDGHYKLFWNNDGNMDKNPKHKVFWVECEQLSPSPSLNPTPTPSIIPKLTPGPTLTSPPSSNPPMIPQPSATPSSTPTSPSVSSPIPSPSLPTVKVTPPPTKATVPPTDTEGLVLMQNNIFNTGLALTLVFLIAITLFFGVFATNRRFAKEFNKFIKK